MPPNRSSRVGDDFRVRPVSDEVAPASGFRFLAGSMPADEIRRNSAHDPGEDEMVL
jgi:hypothetical protein